MRERPLETAEHRLDAGDELSRTEWLGNIVVGAELQAQNAVCLATFCGQENDRDRGKRWDLPNLTAEFEPIFAWNHDVQNEQCRTLPFRLCKDGIPSGEYFHGESICLEIDLPKKQILVDLPEGIDED